MNDQKRLLREEKRAVKKAGNRHRRRELKRSLEAPESAHEAEPELGKNRSEELNGQDRVRSDVPAAKPFPADLPEFARRPMPEDADRGRSTRDGD